MRPLDVVGGDARAENLLQLELDRRADLAQLIREVLGVKRGRGELASCGAGSAVVGAATNVNGE